MIEETLRFIESLEVRNYLREFLKTFGGITEERKRAGHRWQLCSSIVCFAPAPAEQKIPVLDFIAGQTESNQEEDSCGAAKFAKEYRIALEERYNNPPVPCSGSDLIMIMKAAVMALAMPFLPSLTPQSAA